MSRDFHAAGDAAPLADVGLHEAQQPRIEHAAEGVEPADVLAGGERNRARLRGGAPRIDRFVGEDRLLDPVRTQRREFGDAQRRVLRRPRLVRVEHDRRVVTERVAQRSEVRVIALDPEADLQLERTVALVTLGERDLDDPIGADAARVHANVRRGPAQMLPQGNARPPRRHVPERLIDRPDDLGEGAGLTALDRHCARAPLEHGAYPRRVVGGCPREQGYEQAVDEALAVLGADLREIAEDLTPALRAIARAQPQEDGRAVRHRAESIGHRRCDGCAEDAALDVDDGRQGLVGIVG